MVNQVLISLIKSIKARNLFLVVLFCVFLNPVFAIDPVLVTVGSQQIGINQTLSVSFTFSQAGVEGFNFPRNTADYEVVASSSSSNIQVINGKISQSKTLSYVLKPLHEGSMNIPAVSYSLGAQAYQTQPTQITVTAATIQAPNPPPSMGGRPMAIHQPPVAQRQANTSADPIVVNSASNYNPYVNQQFFIKTKIYHRGNLKGLSLATLQIDHVNIKRSDQAKEYTEVKNGLEYMVYEIDYIAFPLKSGPIRIPEYDVNATVIRERPRNMGTRIDPFTFMNYLFEESEIVVKAPAININVKPLPANAPKGFSGYVGSLAVNHQVDKLSVNSGDPITFKTNVYGNGNPKILSFDFFEKSQLYSIYKDKENLNVEINSGVEHFGLNTSTAIIPERKSGKLIIKTKPLISFNPVTKKFESHGEEEFEILVKPSTGEDSNGSISDEEALQAKAKTEEFKKEISIYSVDEIQSYKYWRSFKLDYLLIFLLILNLAYFTRYISRRVKFKTNENKFDFKLLTARIKKATELEEISSVIKDLEKELGDNESLKEKFKHFTQETDKYNYGFMKNFNEAKFDELKKTAIDLIKELKVNA